MKSVNCRANVHSLKGKIYFFILIFIYWHHFYTLALLNDFLPSPECSSTEFILPHMAYCHPILSCRDAVHMKPIKLITSGVVKNVWLVEWKNWSIVMSKLRDSRYIEDFNANLKNLLYFKGNGNVSNLIGYCGSTIFTQYYPYDYAQILALLHEHSMVMCDSNSLAKTLSQYLITNQMRLILNDLDALPRMKRNELIRCAPRQEYGDLLAPEQLWPHSDKFYDQVRIPMYNEKVDIWKIPDVCHWILIDLPISALIQKLLHYIHSRCKTNDIQSRPTARDVVKFYLLIKQLA